MLVIKICLLGDGAVGKSALRQRFMGEQFHQSYLLTIGADFAAKDIKCAGTDIRFQIWDLAGQTHFSSVRSLYYKGCMGALAVYDVTRPATFDNLEAWCNEFWNNNGSGIRPLVVLGNKTDLIDSLPPEQIVGSRQGQIISEMLESKSKDRGVKITYLDTSAKTGLNVDNAFICLGDLIIDYMRANPQYAPPGYFQG